MTRRRDHGEAGFAMVEAIAVLVLSALVMLTLLIATDLVSRNSAAATRQASAIEAFATGLAAVRRDLERAEFLRVGPEPTDAVLFSGSEQAVALLASDDGTGSGESLILIEARYENGIGSLVRSSARWLPGQNGFGTGAFANHALVLSGPYQFRFSYAGGGGQAWQAGWTQQPRLPSAVRLEVVGADSRPAGPPLIARLAVTSGGCADPALTDCPSTGGSDSDDEAGGEGGEGDDADIDF